MATDAITVGAVRDSVRPYAPSWLNRLNDAIERLPGPPIVAYLVLAGVMTASSVGYVTIFDPGASGLTIVGQTYYGILPVALLWFVRHLDYVAREALAEFRPALDLDDEQVARLRWELTVTPARPAAIAAIFTIAVTPVSYILDPVGTQVAGLAPAALAIRFATECFVGSLFFLLLIHTARQLRLVGRIQALARSVDLLRPGPLYAFSRVTSQTAIGIILLMAPSIPLIPSGATEVTWLLTATWLGSAALIASAAFFLPLQGMHRRMAAEKSRMEMEVGERIRTTIDVLHRGVDEGDGSRSDATNKTLASLIAERDLVHRLSTWPWQTGTLGAFGSAILLPLVLFLVQRFLSSVV